MRENIEVPNHSGHLHSAFWIIFAWLASDCDILDWHINKVYSNNENHPDLEIELEMGLFVCVEVLWPSQPNGVMSCTVSLPDHMFTGQA